MVIWKQNSRVENGQKTLRQNTYATQGHTMFFFPGPALRLPLPPLSRPKNREYVFFSNKTEKNRCFEAFLASIDQQHVVQTIHNTSEPSRGRCCSSKRIKSSSKHQSVSISIYVRHVLCVNKMVERTAALSRNKNAPQHKTKNLRSLKRIAKVYTNIRLGSESYVHILPGGCPLATGVVRFRVRCGGVVGWCGSVLVPGIYGLKTRTIPKLYCSLGLSRPIFFFRVMFISIAHSFADRGPKADLELQRTTCDNQSMTRQGIANDDTSTSFSSLCSLQRTRGIVACFALLCGG